MDEGSQEKLIVCAFYLLFGMALIAMCFKVGMSPILFSHQHFFQLMQDDVVQKARWLGQKIGILGKSTFITLSILSAVYGATHCKWVLLRFLLLEPVGLGRLFGSAVGIFRIARHLNSKALAEFCLQIKP